MYLSRAAALLLLIGAATCARGDLYSTEPGTLIGRVMDGRGHPVRNASVRLYRPYDLNDLDGRPKGVKPEREVRTDTEGTFRVTSLLPGLWVFRCDADGYMEYPRIEGVWPLGVPRYPRAWLAPGGRAEVSISMTARTVLWGRVIGPHGKPVLNQRVDFGIGGPGRTRTTWTAQTDRAGYYELPIFYHSLPAGVPDSPVWFTVGVVDEGFTWSGAELKEGERVRADMRLTEGVPLTGRLIDKATGKPLPERKVIFMPSVPGQGDSMGLSIFPLSYASVWHQGEGTTDSDGRFEVRLAPSFRYEVTAQERDGLGDAVYGARIETETVGISAAVREWLRQGRWAEPENDEDRARIIFATPP